MINNTLLPSGEPSLNDQFNPRLVVDETNGQLVVIYYDTVKDTGRLKTEVLLQTSDDSGVNWSEPIPVTINQTDETSPGYDSHQYGEYNGLSGYAGTFFPSWTDRRDITFHEQIWTRRIKIPSLPEEPCPMDPILTSATISFHTSIDDKDHDTYLIIDVNTVRNENAAHVEGFVYEDEDDPNNNFNDNEDSGPFSLLVNGPWFTKSRIKFLRIAIHPCGDDTWNFNFNLDLAFSNGEHIHLFRTDQELSDENTEKVYYF
jgi:hypothetical protein